MRQRLFVRLALVPVLVVLACLPSPGGDSGLVPADERTAAPVFALTDSGGRAIRLADYKGRVVLLDFWATWCTGCKVEIPWYMQFQKQYARRGLASIGVAMDEKGWETVRPYLKKKPINYPIVAGDDAFAKAYGVESLPVTLLIDRQGRVAETHAGMVERSAWEHDIQALLKE